MYQNKQKKQAEKANREGQIGKTAANKIKIQEILSDGAEQSSLEITANFELSPARIRAILLEMTEDGIIEPVGNGRSRKYRLKASMNSNLKNE